MKKKSRKRKQSFMVMAVWFHLFLVSHQYCTEWASQAVPAVKNPPTNAGDTETWVRSLDQDDTMEEETTTHSSILAWRTPRTEEPGGLQSIGWQRVGHTWGDLEQQQQCTEQRQRWRSLSSRKEYHRTTFCSDYLKFLGGNVCLLFKLFFPGETHSIPNAFSLIRPLVLYCSYFSDESTDLGSMELLFSQRFTASEWTELYLSPCPLGKVTIPDCES